MAKRKTKTAGKTRANSTGSIWIHPVTGRMFAVVTWSAAPDRNGKRKRHVLRAPVPSGTRAEAYELMPALLARAEAMRRLEANSTPTSPTSSGAPKQRNITPDRITFGELAEYHKTDNLVPAEFNDQDVRIHGLKTWKDVRRIIDQLVAHFGPTKPVAALTLADLKRYRAARLRTAPQARYKAKGSDTMITTIRLNADGTTPHRSAASPHRELAHLRRMINYAYEEGWLTVQPIRSWKELIKIGDEVKRTTIAGDDAEKALLKACATDPKRAQLIPYLLAAFDTGCRSSELRGLLVRDIDWSAGKFGAFVVCSDKGKHRLRRPVRMTSRVREAVLECCKGKQPTDHVFSYDVTITHEDGTTAIEHRPRTRAPRKAFKTARRGAGAASGGAIDLSGFRGHDMRHTMITRAIERGVSVAEIGKYTGHTQPSTTWRYINPGEASQDRIADVMEQNNPAAGVLPFAKRKKRA